MRNNHLETQPLLEKNIDGKISLKQVFKDLNLDIKQSKVTPQKILYNCAKGSFIVIVGAAVPWLYIDASVEYINNITGLPSSIPPWALWIIPIGTTTVNVCQAVYGAAANWQDFEKIVTNRNDPIWQKIFKLAGGTVIGFIPAVAPIFGAVGQSQQPGTPPYLKALLIGSTTITAVPLNINAGITLMSDVNWAIKSLRQYFFGKKENFPASSELQTLFIRDLRDAIKQLTKVPSAAIELKAALENKNMLAKKFSLFAETGAKWRENQPPATSTSWGTWFFGGTFKLLTATMCVGSLGGYQCGTLEFWSKILKNTPSDYLLTETTILSLAYLLGKFGYGFGGFIVDTLQSAIRGEKIDWPFALQNKPTVAIPLGFLAGLLSAFSFALTEQFITEFCPKVLSAPLVEAFKYLGYGGVPLINLLFTTKVFNSAILVCINFWGGEKAAALKLIEIAEKMIDKLSNMPSNEFAQALNSEYFQVLAELLIKVPGGELDILFARAAQEYEDYKSKAQEQPKDGKTLLINPEVNLGGGRVRSGSEISIPDYNNN